MNGIIVFIQIGTYEGDMRVYLYDVIYTFMNEKDLGMSIRLEKGKGPRNLDFQ